MGDKYGSSANALIHAPQRHISLGAPSGVSLFFVTVHYEASNSKGVANKLNVITMMG